VSHYPRRLVVISVAVSAWLSFLGPSGTPAFAECSQADRNAGTCRSVDGSTQDNQVIIQVNTARPGSPGTQGGSTTSQGTGSGVSGGQSTSNGPSSSSQPTRPGQVTNQTSSSNSTQRPPRQPVLGSSECQIMIAGLCRAQSPPRVVPAPATAAPPPPPAPPPAPPRPPTPPRFASELGAYTPDRPSFASEPGDWSLPTLPTNFVAQATTHIRRGQLAGWPVEVRFTPVRFHWTFGDGTRRTVTEAGKTWRELGLRQFDPTPTSHVYRRPGVYTARVVVDYRAEFRFVGESFQPVSGTVSATSPSQRVRVLTVSPLLVG
jgi:hypothetical protein